MVPALLEPEDKDPEVRRLLSPRLPDISSPGPCARTEDTDLPIPGSRPAAARLAAAALSASEILTLPVLPEREPEPDIPSLPEDGGIRLPPVLYLSPISLLYPRCGSVFRL